MKSMQVLCKPMNHLYPCPSCSHVVSPHSEFWNRPNQSSGQVPLAIQRDIIGAYLLQKRCTEELMLLQNEIQNVVDYYNQMECNIKTAIFYISEEESQFSRGCVSLLSSEEPSVTSQPSTFRSSFLIFYCNF